MKKSAEITSKPKAKIKINKVIGKLLEPKLEERV